MSIHGLWFGDGWAGDWFGSLTDEPGAGGYFGHRYFASRWYGPRYFPPAEAATPPAGPGGLFPHRYFGARYFAVRYFAPVVEIAPPAEVNGGLFPHRYFPARWYGPRYFAPIEVGAGSPVFGGGGGRISVLPRYDKLPKPWINLRRQEEDLMVMLT